MTFTHTEASEKAFREIFLDPLNHELKRKYAELIISEGDVVRGSIILLGFEENATLGKCSYNIDKYRERIIWQEKGFFTRLKTDCRDFIENCEKLFKEEPIYYVELSDLAPLKLPKSFVIIRERRIDADDHSEFEMPTELFYALDYGRSPKGYSARFEAESEAKRWISRSCVQYARNKVGLPPIKWPN